MTALRPVRIDFANVPPGQERRPAIFLDRDGVINRRIVGGYVTRWAEFQFLEGMIVALRELSRLKLPMIVVSNQAGAGKGLMRRSDLAVITARFVGALARRRARIDAVYYCPHASEQACSCRKPHPGLLLAAARDWKIDLRRSVLVGDSLRDIEAAHAAGCRAILFDPGEDFSASGAAGPDGSGRPTVSVPVAAAVWRPADLYDQVRTILGRPGHPL